MLGTAELFVHLFIQIFGNKIDFNFLKRTRDLSSKAAPSIDVEMLFERKYLQFYKGVDYIVRAFI